VIIEAHNGNLAVNPLQYLSLSYIWGLML